MNIIGNKKSKYLQNRFLSSSQSKQLHTGALMSKALCSCWWCQQHWQWDKHTVCVSPSKMSLEADGIVSGVSCLKLMLSLIVPSPNDWVIRTVRTQQLWQGIYSLAKCGLCAFLHDSILWYINVWLWTNSVPHSQSCLCFSRVKVKCVHSGWGLKQYRHAVCSK